MAKMIRLVEAAWVMASLCACGTQGEDFWSQQERAGEGLDSRPIADVLRQDLADISELSDIRASSDRHVSNAFGQLFDGHDGHAVRAYIDGRVKHFLTYEDLQGADIVPDILKLKHKAWMKQSESEPDAGPKPEGPPRLGPEPRARVGAQNLGMALWLQGSINETPLALQLRGQTIALDSPRAGVMLIGEAYRPSGFFDDVYQDPGPIVRQHVLVHESRHSDCTGGISSRDLALGRSAKNHAEFLGNITNIQCGHLHVPCKAGPLEGVLACDAHPWGSYTAGLIYLQGAKASLDPYSPEAVMADAVTVDILSRLQFSYPDMMAGRLGPPDMSHSTKRVP